MNNCKICEGNIPFCNSCNDYEGEGNDYRIR
jgi:hypothetical protein